MGEVDEAQHPIDQRVSEGDEGVDRAEREAVERLSAELLDQATEAGVDWSSLSESDGQRSCALRPATHLDGVI